MDCMFHGYSGFAGGLCYKCDQEEKMDLPVGTLEPFDSMLARAVMDGEHPDPTVRTRRR